MSDKSKSQQHELFEQAIKNYEQALQATLKLQQESAKWWTSMLTQTESFQDWQSRLNKISSDSMVLIQKRLEENLKLIEQNSRTSLQLFRKAVEVGTSDSISAAQSKLEDLWEASLETLRANATATSQANAKWVESWMQFAPKSGSAGRTAATQ